MKNQQVIIESLAMDLQRVAVGMQRGSVAMANRFKEEALQRAAELDNYTQSDYLKKLIFDSRKALLTSSPGVHEDILMYSILFQNFAQFSDFQRSKR